MKVCFDPTIPWFKDRTLRADLGFLGAPADYGSDAEIRLPHKKPRRSKSNPHPRLTKAQKRANRDHSRIRVIVEHTIGGMKYFALPHASNSKPVNDPDRPILRPFRRSLELQNFYNLIT
jgi:hypothetical protein